MNKINLLKKMGAFTTALLLAFGLAACGGTSSATDASGSAGAGSGTAKEPKTLKIITWSNQASVNAMNALAEKYMEKYPNVTVEITDVDTNQYANLQTTRLQANDVDVVTLGGGSFLKAKVDWAPTEAPVWQQLVDNGILLDITDQPWVSNWSTGAEVCEYDGKIWGISTGGNAMTGLFYSKALFAENNWEVPTTWSEFEQLCAAMQAAGVTPLTCGGADSWPYAMIVHSVMSTLGIDYEEYVKGLWTGTAAVNDETGKLAYERIDFINSVMEPGFMGISYAEVTGRFVAGKAAMLPDGSWQAAEIAKADPNFEFGYFPLPSTEGNNDFEGKFDLYFAVNAKSANTEEALAWMEMLSDKDNYTEFVNTCGFIPTMDGITVTNEFLNELLPYTSEMGNAWGQYYRQPTGVGQYAEGTVLFNGQYLKTAGGPVATPEELADLSQKDFAAAVAAVQ